MIKGFTIIELILVVGIIAILGAASFGIGGSMVGRQNVRSAKYQLVAALESAKKYSQSGREDSSWGVRVENNAITVFSGTSYSTRNQSWDEVYSYRPNISITQSEIIFTKQQGLPSSPATISISGPAGVIQSVSISAQGVINAN